MDVTPFIPANRQVIQSYGDGGFRITGLRHEGSVLIFPSRTLAWSVTTLGELTLESLGPITEDEPPVEILLLGTGATMQLIPAAMRRHFRAHGVILDAMDTGAACRTYNVLLAEDRRVAAALMAV